MEKNTRSLDWKQEKLRGSTVRCARGHLRGKPWLRYTFSWEQLFFRGLTKKNFFFGESHNSENFTKKYSLSYWSRALSNFSFLVFRFSGPHKERPKERPNFKVAAFTFLRRGERRNDSCLKTFKQSSCLARLGSNTL